MVLHLGLTFMSFRASAPHTILRNNSLGMRKVLLKGCGCWDIFGHTWNELKEDPERYSIWFFFFFNLPEQLYPTFTMHSQAFCLCNKINNFFFFFQSRIVMQHLRRDCERLPTVDQMDRYCVNDLLNKADLKTPSSPPVLPMYRNSKLIQRLFFLLTHILSHMILVKLFVFEQSDIWSYFSESNRKFDLE